jgi:hypothetical protein
MPAAANGPNTMIVSNTRILLKYIAGLLMMVRWMVLCQQSPMLAKHGRSLN